MRPPRPFPNQGSIREENGIWKRRTPPDGFAAPTFRLADRFVSLLGIMLGGLSGILVVLLCCGPGAIFALPFTAMLDPGTGILVGAGFGGIIGVVISSLLTLVLD